MPMFRPLARSVPAAILLATLGGCSWTSVATDPLKLPANSGQSPVVVSITANTSQVQGFTTLTVRLVPAMGQQAEIAQYFVLNRTAPEMARDTSVFIGALAPGRYEFTSLDDVKSQKILRLNNAAKLIGPFQVEAGKPVDLGRLVVTPVNASAVIGRSARIESNAALLARASPEHAALFARAAPSGWGHPRLEEDKVEEYASARPVGVNCATELPDGGVIAASRLGMVLRRDPAGRWATVRGPGIDSLLCVTPADLPDAELLAVGEFTTLLRKPPNEGRLLPVDTGNLPKGNIVGIAGNRKAGWTVGVQSGDKVTVLHTPDLHGGAWTPVETVDVGPSFWSGASHFWMWGDDKRMGYAVSEGPIHELDYASGTWTAVDTPNRAHLMDLVVEPAGGFSALTAAPAGAGGLFASEFLSNDRARTWHPVAIPFNVKVMPVRRDYAGNLYASGGVFGDQELQVSKDNGVTWTQASKREFRRQLLPLRAGGLLDFGGAEQGIFSIEHSTDGGRTWKIEYTNFDRRAYEMRRR